ncbi:YbaN family protein [candidate division KSB1 bacterium]|nr:YbaN family protein [candidate division KSB1 bacterium]
MSNPEIPTWKRILLITAGILSIFLGTLGLFLPLLPTTPFLLLAAACFVRSSDRFYTWLINHRIFGSYIRNYREKGGITRKHKVITITFLWLVIILTVLFLISHLILKLFLLAVASLVTFHILSIHTVKK